MIVQGKVPVTWTENDYKDATFTSHPNPYRGFNASGEISKGAVKLDVHICYEIHDRIKKSLEHFSLDNTAVQLQKYLPGDYLPFHSDTYATYKKHHNIDKSHRVVRIIVFLHDSYPGQQLWIADKVYTGKAGDYFGWTDDTEHMAANLGSVPRYNLQITGTANL